jgi:Protein tyrosine and serine/threonine kinase/Leucine rich repeat
MSSQQVLEQLKSGLLVGIKRLDLSCGLTEFPREIFDLADSLEILNLSGNKLSSLPDDLPSLHKLRIIFCSDNLFTELPAVLGQCKNLTMVGFKANQISCVPEAAFAPTLRWLILTDNRIQSLPSSIGQCRQMQKLMLAGNQLSDLPVELANCSQLELLRLSANQFAVLPAWLLEMPRLAWLALAGNPLTDSFEVARQASSIAEIDWQDIELGAKLGEGASGVIYQAKLLHTDESFKEVAVKLFKSAVTSDGMPRSEMAASIAVGLHPHIVGVMGKISHHPNETMGLNMGLVMPLITGNYTNLAQPPSLESCTRDVYVDNVEKTAFGLSHFYNLAFGIARAAEHLHASGILHGDLYAHNILHDSKGHGFLGDFGAASFLPIQDKDTSQALQRIEVRAFGILLGELLALCSESADDVEQAIKSKFVALQRRCTQAHVPERPLLAEVVSALHLHMEVASSSS